MTEHHKAEVRAEKALTDKEEDLNQENFKQKWQKYQKTVSLRSA